MKKILLILGLAYVQMASAQSASQAVTTDTSIQSRLIQMETKVNRQEEQLKALETENRLMKKERSAKKPAESGRKKVSISRQGSKQVVVE